MPKDISFINFTKANFAIFDYYLFQNFAIFCSFFSSLQIILGFDLKRVK